jgi:hypothetical protein
MSKYNGFNVRCIGPVVKVAGGYVRKVEIIDPPKFVFETRFNAVCYSNGILH